MGEEKGREKKGEGRKRYMGEKGKDGGREGGVKRRMEEKGKEREEDTK